MKIMQELFYKYLDNECSPAEVKKLLSYFNYPENEGMLKGLITSSLESLDNDEEEDNWKQATDESFAVIKKQLGAQGKLVPIYKRTWFRVAATVVILAGAFAIYNLTGKTNHKEDIVKTYQVTEQDPGSNKAVLTLADGSTINLESAANGMVSQQGQTKIVKHANGQLAYEPSNQKGSEVFFNSVTTPRGGQYCVTLSDGSKVYLNAASSLRFPAGFDGKERKVELNGEAYFEVTKNAAMPFKVITSGKGEVEVLGTHFNVNAYPDEPTINTTLFEGSVKLTALANQGSQILTPGEQAKLQRNGQISINKNADTEQAMAWKKGVFNFNNSDLEMLFRQLSRWYDVDVKFQGPIQSREFNGEMQRDLKLTQVLKLLEKNNVFCKLEGKTVVVLK
jgi:transmembrane sensor